MEFSAKLCASTYFKILNPNCMIATQGPTDRIRSSELDMIIN